MSRVLVFKGRNLYTNEKVTGYGIKQIGENCILITKDGDVSINPSSLMLIDYEKPEPYSKNVMSQEQISELHELLVSTVINYLNDNNIKEVEEVDFSVNCLSDSVKCHEWVPSTDSSISICGYEDSERRIIGSNG